MLADISSWKKTRITVTYPNQSPIVEEVIKPQRVIDKIVEDHRENGALSVIVESVEEAVIPDNKAFGRHGGGRLGTDPFTREEISETQRAQDYWEMSYVDESNRIRYRLSCVLVEEEILDLLYCHGHITADQQAATINQTRRTE